MKTFLAALLLAGPLPAAAGDVLLDALKAELARSTSALASAETAPLYHLSYEVYDSSSLYLSAKLGSVQAEQFSRGRTLDADARVGSFALDNNHEFKGGGVRNSRRQESARLPVEDDPAAIRAGIWALTDRAYKAAQDQYARVKTNRSVTAEEEDASGDFSPAEPASFYEKARFPELDLPALRAMLKRLSSRMLGREHIYNSEVVLAADSLNKYIVASEGASIVTGNSFLRLIVTLYTRTPDGMDLSRTRIYDSDGTSPLPAENAIAADLDAAMAELEALRAAPPEQPYSGPVLLGSRAAGVFFHEILGHRLEGHRQKSEQSGQTFAKKVGQPVMPDFLSVYDDPSVRELNGQFLRGWYRYDDEGVAARRASLVEKGVLKGFLMSRSPIKGFPASNGHGRRSQGRGVVARMGNLIVESSNKAPAAELRARLLEEARKAGKPYALYVTDIAGGFTITDRDLPQSFSVEATMAYKIFADGRRDEPVRGLNLIGTPLQTFSRILVTGDDAEPFNGSCGAESGWVPVAAVSPSLLFSEMETEKVKKSSAKPPVLPPPFKEKP